MTTNINSILRQMKRNPFFLPSGFIEQEKINISEYKSDAKRMQNKIKFRRQQERRIFKLKKIAKQRTSGIRKLLKIDEQPKVDQIQRGRDLAKEWGYDGLDRTYHPTLMKAR